MLLPKWMWLVLGWIGVEGFLFHRSVEVMILEVLVGIFIVLLNIAENFRLFFTQWNEDAVDGRNRVPETYQQMD